MDGAAARISRKRWSRRSPKRPAPAGGVAAWFVVAGIAAAVLLAVGVTVGVYVNREQPVEFAASLSGTELAPDATGDVTLTKTPSGWDIRLHATGLPRREDGEFYQAWLKNDAGLLVPIGSFNDGRDVTLWAGVAPSTLLDADRHPGGRRRRPGVVGPGRAHRPGGRVRSVRTVRVGAVCDPVQDHDSCFLVQAEDDAVVTAASRSVALEVAAQRLAHPRGVVRENGGDELDDGHRDPRR